MNLIQGIATILVTLLGSGVFIVPAISATYSGWGALIVWLIMAFMILPVAFVFGKLGKAYPSAGGSATFVGAAFGKKLEKATAYLYLSMTPIGPPVVIITAASYLAGAFGEGYLIHFMLLASLIILVLNLFSLRVSSNINILVSTTITLIVVIFSVYAFLKGVKISLHQLEIFKTLGVVFWCFVGIEALSHISHEFKNENDFFKAVIIGIVIVAVLYMGVTFSILTFNAYGSESKNLRSLVIVASHLTPHAKEILGIMAFIICVMALNLYVASLTRLATTLKIGFKSALFLIMGIITGVSLLKFSLNLPVEKLITYSNGVFVMIYLLVSLAAVKLLKNTISVLAVASMCAIVLSIGKDIIYAALAFFLFWYLG